MHLIAVPDIFGVTPEFNELTSRLAEGYQEIITVDPYEGNATDFHSENRAYRYFQEHCGADKFRQKVLQAIRRAGDPVDLLGFSVGATAAWELSGRAELKMIRKIVCFYGSRIREKTGTIPNFPTTVVFPCLEESFDIAPVIRAIEANPLSGAVRTPYLHGFMNRRSANFSQSGYRTYVKWLINRCNTAGQ